MEASRTFIGSVVCVDLVGYSKRSIAQQSAIKEAFNQILSRVIRGVPPEDRIILDTGDGAAISFLGDPEACLEVGLQMRDAMNAASAELGVTEADSGPVRIGINLGPMKVAVDMNGYPNIIGDGINVAERIVTFAQPGQIVVSRPFHDMVSQISAEHAKIFRYEGVRTDKNVREHELYSVDKPVNAPSPPPLAELAASPPIQPGTEAGVMRKSGALASFLRDSAKVGIVAAFLLAVIATEAWMLSNRSPSVVATRDEAVKRTEPAKPLPAAVKAPTVPVIETKAPPPKVDPKPLPIEKKAAPPTIAEKPSPPRAETKLAPVETKASRATAPIAPMSPPSPTVPPTQPEPTIREEPKPAPPPPVTQAVPILRAAPSFPIAAASRGIETGTVRARLAINAAGAVTQVNILSANPPRIFDREAIRSLEGWKFNTGAEARTYEVEIEFKR